jgi:DNA ligase-associated metallophosphoesterase
MMHPMLTIDLAGHALTLLPQRAVVWRETESLLLADTHFGKTATFRDAGMAVPDNTAADLARLDELLARHVSRRLIILGDFLHSASGRSASVFDAMADWRTRHERLEILLVRGNHDRSAGDPPPELGINCVDEPHEISGLTLCHDPACGAGDLPMVAGHLHPAVTVRDYGRSMLRLPCFHRQHDRLTMPAFGSFTGMKTLPSEVPGHRWAATPEGVFRAK